MSTLSAKQYVNVLKSCGVRFFAGVPCSVTRGVLYHLEKDSSLTYVPAVREDAAVSMAAGAWLGGWKSMVLMQNSGIGTCLDVLISLNLTYKIPLLLLITWRGFEHTDEPQHWIWGDRSNGILGESGIPYSILSDNVVEETRRAITETDECLEPRALILKRGTCIDEEI